MAFVASVKDYVAEWLRYFCSLSELFTLSKHALYCTHVLYSVAVYDEANVFDTFKQNIQRSNSCCENVQRVI